MEGGEFTLPIYTGSVAAGTIYCPVSARSDTTASDVIEHVKNRLCLEHGRCYVLAEVREFGGEEWILNPTDCPVRCMQLWPRPSVERSCGEGEFRFLLREKDPDGSVRYGNAQSWPHTTEERQRRLVERGLLPQPPQVDHDDLCNLLDVSEDVLLAHLRSRFRQEKIYTYLGSILLALNPFRFLPLYNPKYVRQYSSPWPGSLEPHIYALSHTAYHAMLRRRHPQVIIISGEGASGKTQNANFLIHHLASLSQRGCTSRAERAILGAGPVLEAFGNAKTAQNNNSSRFGKFIQVSYQESGTMRGAYVQKYLLEKSRLVYQDPKERNYHVFYYLLAGANESARAEFHLKQHEEFHYLNQQDCLLVEGVELKQDFERLQMAMEMVGFLPATRKQVFSLLSAILHMGNIRYKRKNREDSVDICNPELLPTVSVLLQVKEKRLFEVLTTRKTVTVGERLVLPYKLSEASTVRDSMAKSLYSSLFDWIVFRINHSLLNTRDLEEHAKSQTLSIGVLDIFGFEDHDSNSFEQFCINFASEQLQHYLNQHIFKLEQEEYEAEGISWQNIDFIDNSGCIDLISRKPTALLHLLDEECNFPQATNQTLLDKFKRQHKGSGFIEFPTVMEPAFIIRHYAGKVKYGVKDFREKNTDHMRPDMVALLKSSRSAFICSLMGVAPVATFRWAVLRACLRALAAFREAGRRYTESKRDLQCTNTWEEKSPRLNKDHSAKPVLPKRLLDVKSLMHLSSMTLQDGVTKSLLHLHRKKRPPSISAQFQASLNKLMEMLSQSEPYFVKCIRSNTEMVPLQFNDSVVLRQLRYTGMLEMVRIRQSGYSIRYTFKQFIQHFHVLLPESSSTAQENIRQYLRQVALHPDAFQVGRTMVFLRESERQHLQDLLRREVLRRVVALQRRVRAVLERRRFIRARRAAVRIQRWWRSCRLERLATESAPGLQQGAAPCVQTALCNDAGLQQEAAMRVPTALHEYREHQRSLLQPASVQAIQRRRHLWCQPGRHAVQCIQHARRCHRVAGRAHLKQKRFRALKKKKLKAHQKLIGQNCSKPEDKAHRIMGLDLNMLPELQSSLWRVGRGPGVKDGVKMEALVDSQEQGGKGWSTESVSGAWSEVGERESSKVMDEPNMESCRMTEVESTESAYPPEEGPTDSVSPLEEELMKVCPLEECQESAELLAEGVPSQTPLDSEHSSGSSTEGRVVTVGAEESSSPFSRPDQVDVSPSNPRTDSPSLAPIPRLPALSIPSAKSTCSVVPQPSGDPGSGTPSRGRGRICRGPLVVLISMRSDAVLDDGEVQPSIREPSDPNMERAEPHSKEKSECQQQLNQREREGDEEQMEEELHERQGEDHTHSERNVLKRTTDNLQEIQQRKQEGAVPKGRQPSHAMCSTPAHSKQPAPCVDVQTTLHLQGVDGQAASPAAKTCHVPEKGSWVPTLTQEPQRGVARETPYKKTTTHTISISMTDRTISHSSIHKDNQGLLTKSDKDCVNQERSKAIGRGEVSRPIHKKRPRISRTRSTLLARGLSQEKEGGSYYTCAPPLLLLHPPLIEQEGESNTEAVYHSDPEMSSSYCEEQKLLQKAVLAGGAGKSSTLGKLTPTESRVRERMRFWRKKARRQKSVALPDGHPTHTGEQPMTPPQEELEGVGLRDPSPGPTKLRSMQISIAGEQLSDKPILTCSVDYKSMDHFLLKKIRELDSEDDQRDTVVDIVFKKALREFRLNIFNSYSTTLALDDEKSVRCKDLYALFEHILEKIMRQEQQDWSESPVTVWLNTFKVLLDEFMMEHKLLESMPRKVTKPDRKTRRRKDPDVVEERLGHIFRSTHYSIPTHCEFCSSLIWVMDSAYVCKLCQYACHRKCCLKMTTSCSKQHNQQQSPRHFGVDLPLLTSEEKTVPQMVEKLISYIEIHGLYTEGIYRKSGSLNKIKELRQRLDTDLNNSDLDSYNVHVITGVFKQWLHSLPNPLMTFELYEEFLLAMDLSDKKDRVGAVFSILKQLSRPHFSTLERLMFHLVRISLQEETNRMSVNALAIVFAPCIMRCPDTSNLLQSMQDISKTTACVELILAEQVKKYRSRLRDISSLEFTETKAQTRLSLVHRSLGKGRLCVTDCHAPSLPVSTLQPGLVGGDEEVGGAMVLSDLQKEEKVLTQQIESLQKEKEELTVDMMTLEPQASDDEALGCEPSIRVAESSDTLNSKPKSAAKSRRSEGWSHQTPRKHLHSSSSFSLHSHLHSRSRSPLSVVPQSIQPSSTLKKPCPVQEDTGRVQFTSRPEGGRLIPIRNSPQNQEHKGNPDFSLAQQVVLYGNKEFMV
ncbi:hypothetical protein MATL_G00141370 [Megalops atlanticus]|uniref:Unconventional myosin-IXa-like n=1 Tax=Megalops atlanticus TaxID=7932 RepID=A0A9D3PWI1_MEGAT|nr:hypothetical protein MATL_G00141370 [Megalops atlanticus]